MARSMDISGFYCEYTRLISVLPQCAVQYMVMVDVVDILKLYKTVENYDYNYEQ